VIYVGPKLSEKRSYKPNFQRNCAPMNCSWMMGATHLETIQGTGKVPLLTKLGKKNLNIAASFLSDEVTVQGWGQS